MSSELPLAQAAVSEESPDQLTPRDRLAVIEGHDADIPTSEESSHVARGPYIPRSEETSTAASFATASEGSTPRATTPTNLEEARSADLADQQQTPRRYQPSSEGLAPSTIAQWVASSPEAASSTVPITYTSEHDQHLHTAQDTTAPFTPEQLLSSTDSEKDTSALPEATRSSIPPAASSTSDENEKKSSASSSREEDIDLEAAHRGSSSSKKEPGTDQTEVDPNIVGWDGPDDPNNPYNWAGGLKWGNVAVISSITFLTPLASSMFAPGVPEVMTEFHSSSTTLESFVVSVYVLGYAFGPLIIAPLSELYGRLPVYHVSNILFVVFTVACAVASNLNMLIGFRFLQGTFGSTPLTIGGGTIADMIVQEKRGGVMAIWALGPLMGPVVGPVAGGYLSQAKGWRWVFWVLAMAGGVIAIAAFIFVRETYAPLLLERKAAKLRKQTGNQNLRSKLASDLTAAELFKLSIVRPMKMLLFSPIVLTLSIYMAVVYGYLYLLFTTITEVYEVQYGFSAGSVGLTYLGIGVGSLIGVITFGIASDRIMKRLSKNGEMKAEYRLPPMIPGSFLVPIGLFMYGWSVEKHVFWFVPILGTGLVGLGLLATFMPISTYLVDAFTTYAASALAANTVLRSLVGALLPLAGQKMYATLGYGWGNSLLAFIALAMCPLPIVLYKYGERIRKSPRFQINL